MNKPIRAVSVVACLMLAALLINVSYSLVMRHEQLSASEYNVRVRNEAFDQDRGAILVGNAAIAQTTPSNDQFRYQRGYPEGPTYAAITGFYSYTYLQSGLEATYNRELAGTSDSLAFARLLDMFTGKPPKGASLETTLNPTIQKAAMAALGNTNGAAVVLDPQTGAVLALASTPSYDPNALASHKPAAEKAAWDQLVANANKPLANRAAREVFPPGSTFKVLITAAALDAGYKPETLVDTPSALTLPGTNSVLTNQDPSCGNGRITLDRAFSLSCNTAFANIAMKLGEAKVADQAKKFGIGTAFLPELGAATSRYPSGMNQAQLAQTGIGQFDVAVTPLQMAMITAAVANDGVVMKPYLVKRVVGPNLETIAQTQPSEFGRAMTAANAKLLQTMMQHVVESGSGTPAQVPGVAVGGKTGTAQNDPNHPPFGWFVAFGPVGGAKVALCIFVQDAPGRSAFELEHAGYSIAAPMAKQVLTAALK